MSKKPQRRLLSKQDALRDTDSRMPLRLGDEVHDATASPERDNSTRGPTCCDGVHSKNKRPNKNNDTENKKKKVTETRPSGRKDGSFSGAAATHASSSQNEIAIVSKRNIGLLNTIRRFSSIGSSSKCGHSDKQEDIALKDTSDGLYCLMQDNPNRIFQCAQNGNAKEVTRIVKSDPTRLHAKNNNGQMALHLAATKGHLAVVQAIVEQKADLDGVDNQGNSALHLAVLHGKVDVCSLLIKSGASTSILNQLKMMPLHTAAELGNLDVISSLLENGADPNCRGDQGLTPLHFAAVKDNGAAMGLIMDKGGKPCTRDDYGNYPIHLAAKAAAANAMEAIIEVALKKGYTRDQILSFKDRENNLPLHAAVNGGDIKAVTVCLKAGASVKVQQDDGSTPLHFACTQGNMEMIRLMESAQHDNFMAAVFIEDSMKRTPLHKASLFNHIQVIEYLLDQGADIESRDSNDRTPLLLSAGKGCWDSVKLLIAKGAGVHVKDKTNQNFLHLAIKFGGKLEQIGADFIKDIKNLQNEQDDLGCTPVHVASKEGHLFALDELIKMGAVLNPKNNLKQSPFHFAARYGRYNTCRRLLDSVHGPNIINEVDGGGLSALHIAAMNGHTKVIQLLLERGAVVNKDHNDNSPLHHASAEGWTHSMKMLLGVYANLRDAVNIDGDTALHVAAKNGQASVVDLLLTMGATIVKNNENMTFFDYIIQHKHSDVAVTTVNHQRWEEVLQMYSEIYGSFILGLIEHLPSVCINVLDRCQTTSDDDPKSDKYHTTYNFKYLDTPYSCLMKARSKSTKGDKPAILPMMPLNVRPPWPFLTLLLSVHLFYPFSFQFQFL